MNQNACTLGKLLFLILPALSWMWKMWFIEEKVLKPTIHKEKITHAEKKAIIGRKAY